MDAPAKTQSLSMIGRLAMIPRCLAIVLVMSSWIVADEHGDQQDLDTLYGCVVIPSEQIDLPAMERGALLSLNVSDGQPIRQGDLLGLIDDHKARMELFAAQTRLQASTKEAENENAILEAEAALRVAISDRDRQYSLYLKNAVTEADYEHAELAAEHAEFALFNRQYEQEISRLKALVDQEAVKASEANIARHQIIAPFDGNVFQIYAHQNEWVDIGEPVLQLVRMDVLRVETKIDGNRYNPDEILGRRVQVWVERARGEQIAFEGSIVNVSLRQSAGKKYQIRAEVQNKQSNGFWLLHPGATVSMTFVDP